MTSAQVVETSVKVTTNSPSQDYTHPDDHNLRTYDMTPGFKPFTNNNNNNNNIHIYSRAILSFAWLTGYAMRPVLLSDTVHTDSFTADNIAPYSNVLRIINKCRADSRLSNLPFKI